MADQPDTTQATHCVTSRTTVLMGLRGSGKTTIGRLLALQRKTRFVDLDDLVVSRLNASSVTQIWQTLGQTRFRKAEADALKEVLDLPATQRPGVLALGGGTPTAPGAGAILTEAILNNTIELIYLHSSPATLAKHLQDTDHRSRPSLTGKPMLDEIEEVYQARDGLYRSLATRLIPIDGKSIEQVLDAIADG